MALVAPQEGELLLLAYMLNKTAPGDPVLRLFTNNIGTIVDGSTIANFTEATQAGYASATLAGTDWTVGASVGVTSANFAAQTFTFTTSATVYGYFITEQSGGDVLWAEVFSAGAFNIPDGGGTIAITPKITLD